MANSPATKNVAARAEVSQPITNMSVIVPTVAWLIPGAGHLIQKRWIRGVLLMVSFVAMYVLGLLMDGRVYRLNGFDILLILGFIGDVGPGWLYIGTRGMDLGQGEFASDPAGYGA